MSREHRPTPAYTRTRLDNSPRPIRPGQGLFQLVWQVMGSNHRRLSRRFYSPILLFEAYAANLPLCAPRRNFGPPPSAMRPCAGSRRRGDARTGTDGGVRRLRLHAPIRAIVAFDLRRSRCHFTFSVFPAAGFGLGVLGAEGVGDALIGGIGLTVAAVRVDLEQGGDAVGDLGRTPRSWAVEVPPRAINCGEAIPGTLVRLDGSRCRLRAR